MAILEFQPNSPEFQRSGESPVRMVIGGIDFLGYGSWRGESHSPWLDLPLVQFAVWGVVSLRAVERIGRYAIELDEYGDALLFRTIGSDVLVHSTRWERTGRIGLVALRKLWESFASSAREFVENTEVSQRYDSWWKWMDTDQQNVEKMSWEEWFAGHQDCFERVDVSE